MTASYISPGMRELQERWVLVGKFELKRRTNRRILILLPDRAVEAGVLLLNEIGLDPGIDHCSAFSMLADLRQHGRSIDSFASFCGGLPAPECANVPLRYKFSWSPRGVLSAALNSAQYLANGKVTIQSL